MRVLLVLSIFLACSWAKNDADPTANILKQLQESGAMDQVKEELEKMLQDRDQMDTLKDQIVASEKALRQKIAEQVADTKTKTAAAGDEKEDEVLAFVKTYDEEKKLGFGHDLISHISKIPISKTKTTHFVQMSSVLDQLATAIKSGRVKEKDILASKLTSLDDLKEQLKPKPKETKVPTKKEKLPETKETKPEKKRKENQISRAIKTFAAMAGNNPDMLVNMLLMGMANYELVSPQTLEMMRGYSKGLGKIDGAGAWITYLADKLVWLAESEEGETFMEIFPMLLEEGTREKAYGKLHDETRRQWDKFFNTINNDDLKHGFLIQTAEHFNSAYKYVFKDEMKILVANAFLISQGLPAIQPRNMVESLIDIADKCLKLFTTYKLDLKEYKTPIREFIEKVEEEYVRADEFKRLTDKEQSELIARFLDENVVSTAQEVFAAHDFIYSKNHFECADSVICAINEHAQSTNHIKVQVARGLSTALAFNWGRVLEDDDAEAQLYEALEHGANPEGMKCGELYPKPECKIFEWQKDIMSLSFDHEEL